MSNKWSSDTTLKFIQEYKTHECLWNFRSAVYKDRNRRDAAYHKLVGVMNIPDFGVMEVKNKIKNLRSTFNQEKKKVQNSKRSGAGKSAVYKSGVKWLKELEPTMFIGEKRAPFENIPEEEGEQEVVGVDGDEAIGGSLQTASQTSEQASVEAFVLSTPSANAPPIKKKKSNTSQLIHAVQDLKNLHAAVNADDEDSFGAFGNSVASQLRKLSEERALLAQRAIQNILTDYGIEDIRERKNIAYRSTLNRPSSATSTSSPAFHASSPSRSPRPHHPLVLSDGNNEFFVLQPPRRNASPDELPNNFPTHSQSLSPQEPPNDTDKLASLICDSLGEYSNI